MAAGTPVSGQSTESLPPVDSRAWLGLLALFVGGFATRPQMMAVGPLIPLIQDDLGVSHAVVGLLPTIPILCMGLFALVAPIAAQLLGTRLAMTLSIVLMAVFGVVRAIAPDALLILVATVPIGIGIGVGGALLPIAVKERFSRRPAFATGMYTNGIQVGAAGSAAIAAPIALWLGGWRESLVVLSIVTLAVGIAWHVLTRSDAAATRRTGATRPHWPLRDPVAWMLVASFALRAGIFQALLAWLPAIYVERGWSITAAGLLPLAITVGGMPATWLATRSADIRGSRRLYMSVASALMIVVAMLFVVFPDIGYLGAVFCGMCLGTIFPIALTLPLDLAERPADAGALASMMLAGGFLGSAAAPFLLGVARDFRGDFTASLVLLSFFSALMLAVTLFMSPERLAARRAAARPA
jgi:CP family cyanate transporter-like MFS transporter